MIQLEPMPEDEFNEFLEQAVRDYAEENVKGGRWSQENALERSRKDYANLLPEGLNTKDHYLFQVVDMEKKLKLGVIWLHTRFDDFHPSGFIYEILIDEPFRGQGYGKQAMLAIEEKAREFGLKSIGLHVFVHNTIAVKLYEKLGYQNQSLLMSKDLD